MEDPKNLAFLIAFGCLGFFILIGAFVVFILNYQKRIYKNDTKVRELKAQRQIELFEASSAAEEKEKERIARNLHDEINPILNVIKQNLQKHRFYILKDKFDVESFQSDFDLLDRAMDGVRNCSDDLVPSFLLNYGLITSLKDHIRSLNDAEITSASFINATDFSNIVPFSKHDQLNIYRACLEIINNILKHAYCSQLALHLIVLQNVFIIEIKHNGKGLNNTEVDQFAEIKGGLGLKSLKARALLLGAAINYEKGTESSSVILKIPIKNE